MWWNRKQHLAQIFAAFDKDKDGYLNFDEFKYLHAFNFEVSVSEVNEVHFDEMIDFCR